QELGPYAHGTIDIDRALPSDSTVGQANLVHWHAIHEQQANYEALNYHQRKTQRANAWPFVLVAIKRGSSQDRIPPLTAPLFYSSVSSQWPKRRRLVFR